MRFVPLGIAAAAARWAKEDVQVGDVLVKTGEAVLVDIGAADRDGAVFPEADKLDLAREAAPHLGFSHGAHHCLGAPLARMELQVALEVLVGRLPNLRAAVPTSELRWKIGGFMRSVLELPVAWG